MDTAFRRVDGPLSERIEFGTLALHHYVLKSRAEFEQKMKRCAFSWAFRLQLCLASLYCLACSLLACRSSDCACLHCIIKPPCHQGCLG